MSEALTAAIELRDRLVDDVNRSKDRDEYLRLIARYQEANRLVDILQSTV